MKKMAILLGTVLLVLGFGSQAWCITYTATDILTNNTPGALVSSSSSLSTKVTNGGTIGVGVANGAVGGEIDNTIGAALEWITITFDTPQYVSDIKIAFLFPFPQYGDAVLETAQFRTDLGYQFLTAADATNAVWTGSGIASNLEPAIEPLGGVWEISNPYMTSPIQYIEFRAVMLGNGGSSDSDYSIVSVSTATVPEPTTMLLLGLGLVGLAGIRRKL